MISTRTRKAMLATAFALLAPTGAASAEPPPPTCPSGDKTYAGESPRIERGTLEVAGRPYRYSVLLPTDYATSNRSYPVLYWLHGAGGNHVSAFTDPSTPRFMERLTDGQPVIVVFPEGGWLGMYRDWEGPAHRWETFHMRLVRHVDETYRTKAARRYRALAGFSMGGMGAIVYAARHRDQFGHTASFSGLLDTSWRSPTMKAFLTGAGAVALPACGGQTDVPGTWPDWATDRGHWDTHNPTRLVEGLRETSVYVATGDGLPCDDHDREVLARESPTNPLRAMEPFVRDANETFHRAMQRAGVSHEYNPYGCGIHSWRYWERALLSWWPKMMRALHAPAGPAARGDGAPSAKLRPASGRNPVTRQPRRRATRATNFPAKRGRGKGETRTRTGSQRRKTPEGRSHRPRSFRGT